MKDIKSVRTVNFFLILTITLMLTGCGNTVEEQATNDLFEPFINGDAPAYYVDENREPFYISDLPNDPNDFTYCSVGERVDLDNDGEEELIINGAYGGIFLDARNGKIYVLDEGNGTAWVLSYTEFDGKTWVVHSDVLHGGRELYHFTLYDEAGQTVDEITLQKRWENAQEDGPGTIYMYCGEEITKKEYDEIKIKLLK